MAEYKITLRKSVKKDLKPVPKADLIRILERIQGLAHDPRPFGSEKLSGREFYRIRQGDYRIVYSVHDRELTVWVVTVAHRRDVYR